MKKILIKATDLTQRFMAGHEPINAIRNANFAITENTFNIVYGPSGSGKSTLINILSGLQKPTSGSISVMGQNIYSYSEDELAYYRANYIGLVYQTNYWIKSLSVLENVSLPLYCLGFSKTKATKMATLALERLGMSVYAKRYPYYLSGGEQQRLGFARALSTNPMFLLADEPTGNLDSKNADNIIKLLQNCIDEYRSTVILVTHNLEYLSLADSLLEISDGLVTQVDQNVKAAREQIIHELEKQ